MKFSIFIKDAWTGQPLRDAKILLRVGEVEQSAKSDRDGKFFREDEREYGGENLFCRVEMQGHTLWDASTQVEGDDVHLDAELIPETIELAFNVLNIAGKTVEGAQVSIEAFGQQLAKADTDADGMVRVQVGGHSIGKDLEYSVNRKGFVSSTGEFQAKFNVVPKISLEKIESQSRKCWKRFLLVLGTYALFCLGMLQTSNFKGRDQLLIGFFLVCLVGGYICWWRNRFSTEARSKTEIEK